MKRLIIIVCILLSGSILHAATHTYASHSRLSTGNCVKMQISNTGIYKITYDDILNAGLNPQTTGVLGYGGALLDQNFSKYKIDDLPRVAIYRHLGEDQIFGKGDYILFYAQGPIRWNYTDTYFTHTRNHCSDYGYYFLSDADDALWEIETADEIDSTHAIVQRGYTHYDVHEKDLINLVDIEKGKEGGGREFYGERINAGQTLAIPFTIDHIDTTQQMTCLMDVAAVSTSDIYYTAKVGNQTKSIKLAKISSNDFYTKATTNKARITNIRPQTDLTTTLSLSNSNSSAYGFLNYIELNVPCLLNMAGNTLAFRDASYYGSSSHTLFQIDGTSIGAEVWEVTALDSIHRMPTFEKDGYLCFYGDNLSLHEYIVVQTYASDYPSPKFLGRIPNQDLHSLRDIDLVIITPEAFRQPAEQLAEAHWQKDGTTYAVVSDQEVYNEFSSGTPDVSAYRWVMKMLYDRAKDGQSSAPKHLLLMGDGTFDNRKILPYSGMNTLLTYQATNSTVETKAYASDDYFAFLEDKDGLVNNTFFDIYGTMRIGVGRLPVNTIEEAQQIVNKIITYMENRNLGKWKQQLCFLADDGDHGQHTKISDAAAEIVRKKAPDFIVNKIYLDAYPQEKTASTESYPLAYNRYTNLLKTGVLLMDYTGHGSANNICSELFLTKASVSEMENRNQGFWMLATCNYAHFDQEESSSAELAVLNPIGGAIGVMSACRTVYASDNDILNRYVCDTLMGHTSRFQYNMTLGSIIQAAKNKCGRNENKMAYIFLGDPALRLNYPTGMEVVENNTSDTLQALGLVKKSGYIRMENGDTATTFQGKIDISIYDKIQQVTTRDNDETDPSKKVTYTYNDYPNLLYSGVAEVVDGHFEYEFRMPKDIRYNYGKGRIVYCAYDSTQEWEAVGHNDTIIIGGSDSAAIAIHDTIGPDLHIYLDNPDFQDGGKTCEYPHFYADIDDENGINTIGSGIGHDLVLMIDNDIKQSYVLNDCYTSRSGSYQSGQVSYILSQQTEGQHFLQFRAWDMLNNSSTAQLSYQVVSGLNPVLYSVTISPNPCVYGQDLTIRLSTDRPDETLHTTLRVYAISGENIVNISGMNERTFYLSTAQYHMTAGIYIIRMEMRTNSSTTSTSIGKLIVL